MSEQLKLIWMLLLIELVAAGTVLHRRTQTDDNGDKRTESWTTEEADEDFPAPRQDAAADEGFQTYTRNGITLRIKPSTTTLRIGGKNMSPEQLLEQAKYAQDLELIAVRQLLSTGHPVKRANIENGRKHTSTYELAPDGSILYRKVEDIDQADVERRFEEILKQNAPQQPNKLGGSWEWVPNDDEELEEHETLPTTKQQTTPEPNTNPNSTPAAKQPTKPPQIASKPYTPTWQPSASDVQRNFLGAPSTFGQYPKLPDSWRRDEWPQSDPFNPPELPSLGGGFSSEDFDYAPSVESAAPPTQTNTFTSTTTDKDGNIVRTTYTSGPNEWKRKTVKFSTNEQPTETTTMESTTLQTRTIPTLDEFLKTQYAAGNNAKPVATTLATPTTPTTPKTIKTINIADLPPVAVLNINRPIEEQFLQPLVPNAAGLEKPMKTLHVENITPSSEPSEQHVERTKIHTITKTLPNNQTPSSANLDPNMLAILQRAGIQPEEIAHTHGQSITRTRIEPDGRIVKTTYRVSPTYDANSFNLPQRHNYISPSIFSAQFPSSNHQSASHFGLGFTPFGDLPPRFDAPTSTFNPKTLVRDREPLGTDVDDEDVETSTLNPLLIHPLDEAAPVPAATNKAQADPFVSKRAKSEIAAFLTELIKSLDDWHGQQNEFKKTVVDDDGRVLTAKFVLALKFDSL